MSNMLIAHKDSPYFAQLIALRPNARNLLGSYTIFSNEAHEVGDLTPDDLIDVTGLGGDDDTPYDLNTVVMFLYRHMRGNKLQLVQLSQDQARKAQQHPEWIKWLKSRGVLLD